MAATSITQSRDTLITGTLQKVATPYFTDNVLRGIPLLKWLLAAGRYEPVDGGHVIVEPVWLSKNSTAKAFARHEGLNLAVQDEGTEARYEWSRYNANVSFSFDEMAQNAGDAQILNVLKFKLEAAKGSLQELMAVHLHSTGDATDKKTLMGLQALYANDPTTTSVGGIATGETGWRNQANTSAITFNTAAAGEAAWQAMLVNTTYGDKGTTLIECAPAVWNLYATALRARQEFNAPVRMPDSGFDNNALMFGSVPVIWDRHVSQTDDGSGLDGPGTTYSYFIDTNSVRLGYHPAFNFKVDDPVRDADYPGLIWRIFWQGQLLANSRRTGGVITNQS